MSAVAGCSDLHRDNTAAFFPPPTQRRAPTQAETFLRTNYLYPARDYLALTWLGRALLGDEAWNVTADGGVADSSWYTNRDLRRLDPATFGGVTAPRGPWTLVKRKDAGATPGCVASDATGRTWYVKLDHPNHPELGSAAEAIAARIYWVAGYHVPAVFVVTMTGIDDQNIEGRRAAAVLQVPGEPRGAVSMDRFRLRREVRALKLVCAWINDTDRDDHNTLVTVEDGLTRCWLLDFNSALGSWNGQPKDAWRGRRCAWDVEWQLVMLCTLGLVHPDIDPNEEIFSLAVGRFSSALSPAAWRPQNPKTPFDRMTPRDAAWMIKKIDAISDEHLGAIVGAGQYSSASDREYVLQTLITRRAALRTISQAR